MSCAEAFLNKREEGLAFSAPYIQVLKVALAYSTTEPQPSITILRM